ncbi:hypothetical protein [Candidatus Thiothrix anitrata]|jgi:hypothetical protein|uniref:Peptidase MA-like domain-containing protein n=1 Tax=Candidatus Thiothrix anitrata TaxID=2823902 RepID=A0ABX7X7N8_9GAMM|nr:hypothetical protein [Candidatus Thiothrix anitrata]QTR51293.1 hypothetical protein J8380_07030 [Candidatus Thiothrix anitrata]
MRLNSLILLVLLILVPLRVGAFVPPAQVELTTQDWGGAAPADVKAVLDSVITVISPYIAQRKFGTILIQRSEDAPRAMYAKGPNGEYIVQVQASGNYWARIAYQFSHEMCHLMSNYDLAPDNVSGQQWFEEALCEAFGLFTLERMADAWAENPPYPNWRDYAPHLREYSQNNQQETHRQLPKGMKMPAWYQQYREVLRADPYAQDRDLNEVVSNQLLPILSSTPQGWTAINYLNLGEASKDLSLETYLDDWLKNAPPDLQEPVSKIQKLLLASD